MGKFEQALKALQEKYGIEEADLETVADSSIARDEIKEFNAIQRERDELAAKLAHMERAPKLKEAFAKVGVDVDSLPKFGKKVVETFDGDFEDLEALAAWVTDNEIPAKAPADETTEVPVAGQIADQAATSQGRFVSTPSIQEQIAQAEADGNVMASIALKAQLAKEQKVS